MGCFNNHKLEDILEHEMSKFLYHLIRHDFVVSHIEEYLQNETKTYYEFLSLTKILGIHTDINFQIAFWENCYVTYNDKNGIDGILFIPLLLSNGDLQLKCDYIKEYLAININHSKQNKNFSNLVMNLVDFKKIILTYFSCITNIAFESYINSRKNTNNIIGFEKYRKYFSLEKIENFTNFLLDLYTNKKNFVNVGKFFDDNIELLSNDKKIRMVIKEYYEKEKDRENIIQMMKKNIQKDDEEDLNEENNEQQM